MLHMYAIRPAPLAGLGVFATSPIPRGTRIFSELPLLSIPHAHSASSLYSSSLLLSSIQRRELLNLSSHTTRELCFLRWNQALAYTLKSLFSGPKLATGWWNISQHVNTLSIFRSNSFSIPDSISLFPTISRLNHSCVPNAQGNWHSGIERFNVHATRDIGVDEEVTLNYLPEIGSLTAKRREKLLAGYGFKCLCPACGSKSGEVRRMEMQSALRSFAEQAETEKDLKGELRAIKAFINLFEVDGIAGRELASLYLEAAKLYQELGSLEEALRCAERGLEIDEDCLGLDHPQCLENSQILDNLRTHASQKMKF